VFTITARLKLLFNLNVAENEKTESGDDTLFVVLVNNKVEWTFFVRLVQLVGNTLVVFKFKMII
jgi:hypothetical protein